MLVLSDFFLTACCVSFFLFFYFMLSFGAFLCFIVVSPSLYFFFIPFFCFLFCINIIIIKIKTNGSCPKLMRMSTIPGCFVCMRVFSTPSLYNQNFFYISYWIVSCCKWKFNNREKERKKKIKSNNQFSCKNSISILKNFECYFWLAWILWNKNNFLRGSSTDNRASKLWTINFNVFVSNSEFSASYWCFQKSFLFTFCVCRYIYDFDCNIDIILSIGVCKLRITLT